MYNILVLGSGGREHAVAWKLSLSPKCKKIYIAPGNSGTESIGVNLEVNIMDFEAIEKIVENYDIDFLFVGPEAPLVEGIYDYFQEHRVTLIGPSKAAAQLEGSKSFANDFMKEFNIPTAESVTITQDNLIDGLDFISLQKEKIVLKADGLAAGKGVLILEDKAEADKELIAMLNGKFGAASKSVVIEEFLDGIEFSVFVLTDGQSYKILPMAKDYKRIGEGDSGLNTGGMGAISPVPFVDNALMQKVIDKIIEPTIKGLQTRQYTYEGFIFFGLIKVGDEPYVIEYNCRLGDPETEVVLPLLKSDLLDMLEAMRSGTLSNYKVEHSSSTAATIMLVSGGYPESYKKGLPISLDDDLDTSLVFHAGTKTENGILQTNGGRVISVTSVEANKEKALEASLEKIKKIKFSDMYFRRDIGFDL